VTVQIITGDCRTVLPSLPDQSVQCVVTSPPYMGLRDYGVEGQMGLESTLAEYLDGMVTVFREVRRVLRDDGTLWLNIGDSYATHAQAKRQKPRAEQGNGKGLYRIPDQKHFDAKRATGRMRTVPVGLKDKDLMMVPARLAIALVDDGWYVRSDIIWHKPNPMPESVTDRPTSAHEHIFLLTKSPRYYYDASAIAERTLTEGDTRHLRTDHTQTFGRNGDDSRVRTGNPTGATRNARNVWTITPKPFKDAHFATFPPELPERCIKAGSRPGDTVLDPFSGAGTTGLVAQRLSREYIGIELNPEYVAMSERRIRNDAPLFAEVTA
jgi:DNA modification methylase